MSLSKLACGVVALAAFLVPSLAQAEDGYDLWLRYVPVEKAWEKPYRSAATEVVAESSSATLGLAESELQRGLRGMLAPGVPGTTSVTRNGAIVIGTPASSPLIRKLDLPLASLGREGYLVRSETVKGHKITVIAANSDIGVLYGAFRFLQQMQMRQPIDHLDIVSSPHIEYRVMDHWDNLNRTIERGYAGFSIWNWQTLPDYLEPRYTDYARAEASIGINGVVLNNVAAQADMLTPLYIEKAAALAGVFRPYGMRVYFAVRFSAPIEIGGLPTADPLDPRVKAWWQAKADEIYGAIPDFGGFLVKANSEGQPGPGDYNRTHADGANMLAEALAPHHGVVMWRAFVYSPDNHEDRIKQAYDQFVPLDGKFDSNVILQVKNGPLDFQPREPFSPIFGAMPKTQVAVEFQLTKEYLGFATHLAYLAPMWSEVLDSDAYAKGPGSTVAKVVDGSLFGGAHTAMAGVSNVGTDRNWTGSEFNQANWYAFGRLAWDPSASPRAIAGDWAKMTFTADPAFVAPVADMMMASREAVVDYMTPLGLVHLMGTDHHYGPAPWVDNTKRADWNPVYYHRADTEGLGFDRTATGSNAVAQYAPPLAAQFANIDTTPEKYLLWFHHVAWDRKMASGRSLWDELVYRYMHGVEEVAEMHRTWTRMKPYVDAQRFAEEDAFLTIQENEARWWRDACLEYFQTFSHRPFPPGYQPEHPLSYYEALSFPYVAGH